MSRLDERFECMGSEIRVVLEDDRPEPERLRSQADRARAFLHEFDARLSRFRDDSELCALNRDPREAIAASPLLRALVHAGRWAGRRSGGLVDVTLLAELEVCGYRTSRTHVPPAPLADALHAAPARHPATARIRGGWRDLAVDGFGWIRRPRGVRLDSGGVGKGLAADLVTTCFAPGVRYVVSIGGDLAVGGPHDAAQPVAVSDARTGDVAAHLFVERGGVATSGIHRRLWATAGGDYAHHVLDPSTGEPAWTGVVAATAIGANALEAEVLAKMALLSGPAGARRVLRSGGGVIQHDGGTVELVAPAPRVVVPRTFHHQPAA